MEECVALRLAIPGLMRSISSHRLVMLWRFVSFVTRNIICALAQNTTVLLAFRLLAGTFSSSPLANAGGGIADMWAPHERTLATSLYSAGTWFGPSAYVRLHSSVRSSKLLAVVGPLVGVSVSDLFSMRY
jgi:MFS family permease